MFLLEHQRFGYQPTVAAGGTAIVSPGTITQISIGNSGSGYTSGIPTVSVGVDLPALGTNIVNIGTASVSDGNVTSVAITTDGSSMPLETFEHSL